MTPTVPAGAAAPAPAARGARAAAPASAAPTPRAATAVWRTLPDALARTGTVVPRAARGSTSTPARLRFASAVAALAAICLAVFGAWTMQARATALKAADEDAAQLVRLQQIDTSLAAAHAAVTNAFLAGGLEPLESRRDYDAAVSRATDQIAAAAAAQPADAAVLGTLNQRLASYLAQVEQARAGNRQWLPVGSGYLSAASEAMEKQIAPILDVLVDRNRDRLEGELGSSTRHMATFMLLGLATLAVFGVLCMWHARRFRRVLNLPLAAGTLAVLIALLAAGIVLDQANGKAAEVRDGSLARSLAASTARIGGFEAKAQESLGLINRGSGATVEKTKWEPAAAVARTNARAVDPVGVGSDLVDDWDVYSEAHTKIRQADAAGDWEEARRLALDAEANGAFDKFATMTAQVVDRESAAAASGLKDARGGLPWAGGAVVLLGLIAAGGGVIGFGQRQREYR